MTRQQPAVGIIGEGGLFAGRGDFCWQPKGLMPLCGNRSCLWRAECLRAGYLQPAAVVDISCQIAVEVRP